MLKFKKSQIILFGSGIILIMCLFYFFKFGNKQMFEPVVKGSEAQNSIPSTTWEDYEKASFNNLDEIKKSNYNSILGQSEKEKYSQLATFWMKEKNINLFAHYSIEKLKLDNSEKNLTFASQLLIDVLHKEQKAELKYLISEDLIKISELGKAQKTNISKWEIMEAIALVEGKNQTMEGVQKLLAITKSEPKNLEANLMLGKLAVQSGQNDKAITRLTTLISEYPDNSEIMFFLAQAYNQNGDKENAKIWFEKCKKIVKNPEFNKEVDQYLKTQN